VIYFIHAPFNSGNTDWPCSLHRAEHFVDSFSLGVPHVLSMRTPWGTTSRVVDSITECIKDKKSSHIVFFQEQQSRGRAIKIRVIVVRLTSKRVPDPFLGDAHFTPSWWTPPPSLPAVDRRQKDPVKSMWDRLGDDKFDD
jgi:hypothetical protein